MAVKLDLKNKLINGCFEYWQRGTLFNPAYSLDYVADRWQYFKSGTMGAGVSRSVLSPNNNPYSLYLKVFSPQVSLDATHYSAIRQKIEGNILRGFRGKKMVMVLWVYTNKLGTYSVTFRNNAHNRSLVKEITATQSGVWQKHTIRFAHDEAGTWLYDTGVGLEVIIVLSCGATYRTTPDVWQSGNYLASNNQVNFSDNVANEIRLADICLVEDNEGQTREPEFQLAGRDLFEELQLCQRYYEKSYNRDVAPGTNTSEGAASAVFAANATGLSYTIEFKNSKRTLPSVESYAIDGTIGVVTGGAGNEARTIGFIGENSFVISKTPSTARTVNLHWTADAEL